jgi:hypothetical protein
MLTQTAKQSHTDPYMHGTDSHVDKDCQQQQVTGHHVCTAQTHMLTKTAINKQPYMHSTDSHADTDSHSDTD